MFAVGVCSLGLQTVSPVPAHAAECEPSHTFALGGNTDPGAGYFPPSDAVWYEASANFPSSVPDGVRKLDAALSAYHARCPQSHITIWAYSEGAWVTAIVLNGNHGGVPGWLLNAVLFGDPTRPGNNAFGIAPTIVDFHGIDVARHCLRGDGVCDGSTGALGWVNGGWSDVHLRYNRDPRWNGWLQSGGNGDWME